MHAIRRMQRLKTVTSAMSLLATRKHIISASFLCPKAFFQNGE